MGEKELTIYLNDHLAGASLGSSLAEQIRGRHRGTPLGKIMDELSPAIEEDRQTLLDLMRRVGAPVNRAKLVSGFVGEKFSRLKFSGALSADSKHGAFMALETMTLGVAGKRGLWKALQMVDADYPALTSTDFERLIARADSQHAVLERERLKACLGVIGQNA